MHKPINKKRLSVVVWLLIVYGVGIIGVLVYVTKVNRKEGTSFPVSGVSDSVSRPSSSHPSQLPSPNPSNPAPNTSKKTNLFDIERFYNNLQNGMTTTEVIELAGKQPDDCAMTGSIPPSETCFWYSDSKTVTVSYGNKNVVQSKSKTGF